MKIDISMRHKVADVMIWILFADLVPHPVPEKKIKLFNDANLF